MPAHQPRPWRRGSLFGAGLRCPLDREQRAVWRARLELARRGGRLTALHAAIGTALARRLGQDGRCDPSHATLATDAGASERTVRRALEAMAECGMVQWLRRLVRAGWQAMQTSNAYVLVVSSAPIHPAARHGGQADRGTLQKAIPTSGNGPGYGSDEWGRANAMRQLAMLTGQQRQIA